MTRHLEAVAVAQPGQAPTSPRVPGDVGQRLGGDPVRRDLDRRWERRAHRAAGRGGPDGGEPSSRRLSCSARRRRAPTRPSSSSAGGRRSSTTRRTSASAARSSPRRSAQQLRGPCGSVRTRFAAGVGRERDAGQRRAEAVVQVAAQPPAFLLPRADQPFTGGLQLGRQTTVAWRATASGPRERRAPGWSAARSRRSPSPQADAGTPTVGRRRSAAIARSAPSGCRRWRPAAAVAAMATYGSRRLSGSTARPRARHPAGELLPSSRRPAGWPGRRTSRGRPAAAGAAARARRQHQHHRGECRPAQVSGDHPVQQRDQDARSRRRPPATAAARPAPATPPAGCRAGRAGRCRRSPRSGSAGSGTARRPVCRPPGPRPSHGGITISRAAATAAAAGRSRCPGGSERTRDSTPSRYAARVRNSANVQSQSSRS